MFRVRFILMWIRILGSASGNTDPGPVPDRTNSNLLFLFLFFRNLCLIFAYIKRISNFFFLYNLIILVDLYASLSRFFWWIFLWIRIRPNDTDPTGSGSETLNFLWIHSTVPGVRCSPGESRSLRQHHHQSPFRATNDMPLHTPPLRPPPHHSGDQGGRD